MDEPKRSLDAELKYALTQRAATTRDAAHPDPQQLVAYHDGDLDEGEERRVQEHLLWCLECPALLLGLEDLTRSATEKQADKRQGPQGPQWEIRSQSSTKGGSERYRRWSFRPYWLSGLAASLLLATIALAFQVVRLGREIGNLSEPQIDVAVQDLYLADSHRDRADLSEETGPVLVGETEWITLILNAPPSSFQAGTYGDYLLTIENSEGVEIWQRRGLSRSEWDTFSVVIRRRFLAPGTYRLRVFGLQEGRRNAVGEFPLRVGSP